MARSPSVRAVREAQTWESIAKQLRAINNDDRWVKEFARAINAVRKSNGASVLEYLMQVQVKEKVDRKAWIIGRAYLWAATHYLYAAYHAVLEQRIDKVEQHCQAAVRCLLEATELLPSWERDSVQSLAKQVEKIGKKANTDAFYAATHLAAGHTKVFAHARFVPPTVQR